MLIPCMLPAKSKIAPARKGKGQARKWYTNAADFLGESTATISRHADPSDDREWTHPVHVISASQEAHEAMVSDGLRAYRKTPKPDYTVSVEENWRDYLARQLERELAEKFYRRFEGKKLEVMVEGEHPEKTGFVHGTDRRYIPVELPGDAREVGKIVSATGVQSSRHYLDAMRRSEANVNI